MLCLAPVLRQIWCKKEIFEKITIDNQQVTDGGRVLLNPASATNNDIASCKATSYVVFLFYAATNLRKDFVLLQIILQKTEIMNQGKTVFAQIMSLIQKKEFYKCVKIIKI